MVFFRLHVCLEGASMQDFLMWINILESKFNLLEQLLMGKNRDQHWQQHERNVEQMERAKDKITSGSESLRIGKKVWKEACSNYLIVNTRCVDCAKRNYVNIAEHVVHIIKPETQVQFWNIRNWKAICSGCFERIDSAKEINIHDPINGPVDLYTVK